MQIYHCDSFVKFLMTYDNLTIFEDNYLELVCLQLHKTHITLKQSHLSLHATLESSRKCCIIHMNWKSTNEIVTMQVTHLPHAFSLSGIVESSRLKRRPMMNMSGPQIIYCLEEPSVHAFCATLCIARDVHFSPSLQIFFCCIKKGTKYKAWFVYHM